MNKSYSIQNLHPRSNSSFYSCIDINKQMTKDIKKSCIQLINQEKSRPKILIESKVIDRVRSPSFYISKARSAFMKSHSSTNSVSILNYTQKKLKLTYKHPENQLKNQSQETAENLPNWLVRREDFKEVVNKLNLTKNTLPSILFEPVNIRTSEQKKMLVEWVSSVQFFSKISTRIIESICDKLKREDFPKGSKIMQKGEKGDCIYIIFSGTTTVQLEPGIEHCKVSEKAVIGEKALDNAQPRTASVLALTDVIAFKLDKFDYDTILLNLKKQEKNEVLLFIENIEIFQKWSHLKTQNLVFHLIQKDCQDEEVIFNRGSPAETFYIIKSGNVEIQSYVSLIDNNCWPVGGKEWKVLEIQKECIVTIALLGPGDYFGEQCLVSGCNRITRAVAVKSVNLLMINKEEFFSIFNKKDIEELVKSSRYVLPNREALRKKLRDELIQKKNTNKALLDSLNINYKYDESRDSMLDDKTKKLKNLMENIKEREKSDSDKLKKRINFEQIKKIKLKSVKDMNNYFRSIKNN